MTSAAHFVKDVKNWEAIRSDPPTYKPMSTQRRQDMFGNLGALLLALDWSDIFAKGVRRHDHEDLHGLVERITEVTERGVERGVEAAPLGGYGWSQRNDTGTVCPHARRY